MSCYAVYPPPPSLFIHISKQSDGISGRWQVRPGNDTRLRLPVVKEKYKQLTVTNDNVYFIVCAIDETSQQFYRMYKKPITCGTKAAQLIQACLAT